jgi:hypothetical protein
MLLPTRWALPPYRRHGRRYTLSRNGALCVAGMRVPQILHSATRLTTYGSRHSRASAPLCTKTQKLRPCPGRPPYIILSTPLTRGLAARVAHSRTAPAQVHWWPALIGRSVAISAVNFVDCTPRQRDCRVATYAKQAGTPADGDLSLGRTASSLRTESICRLPLGCDTTFR